MTKPIISIDGVEREMNEAEYAQHLKDMAEAQARKDAKAKADADKAALLAKLGITADEAKLLLS
jgi:hypothetical protein